MVPLLRYLCCGTSVASSGLTLRDVDGVFLLAQPANGVEDTLQTQVSSRYLGALALRFARVKRYREDKTASQSDTIETVREIFTRTTGQELP